MIASGLILLVAGCSLGAEIALVRPAPNLASVVAGLVTMAALVVSGNLLLGKGIRDWRIRRQDARRRYVGRVSYRTRADDRQHDGCTATVCFHPDTRFGCTAGDE